MHTPQALTPTHTFPPFPATSMCVTLKESLRTQINFFQGKLQFVGLERGWDFEFKEVAMEERPLNPAAPDGQPLYVTEVTILGSGYLSTHVERDHTGQDSMFILSSLFLICKFLLALGV